MSPADRLLDLGYSVGEPPRPSGPTLPVSAHDGLLYVAGQIPVRDGRLMATGIVGEDVDLGLARGCARQAAANALAHLHAHLGTLDGLRMVRLTVYVAAARGFAEHSEVANAASELLVDVLGGHGHHSRTAIGVSSLPRHSPVEVEVLAARTEGAGQSAQHGRHRL
ncbi:RidA family protein [Streptosporangium fragile]|uniref:RidA family protein n=1 Tax=Streptosporangium fragile TaxID=46186 RepID=A0ABN3VUH9_9ACTN